MDMDKMDVLVSGLIHMLGSTGQKDINADTRVKLLDAMGSPEYDAARTIVIAVLNKAVNRIIYMVKNMEGITQDESTCAECGQAVGYWIEYHGHKHGCKKEVSKNNGGAKE